MAALEVVGLNESTPQLVAAQSGDTYNFPRPVVLTNGMFRGSTTASLGISGGSTEILGANIILYGEGHATKAHDIDFMKDGAIQFFYDASLFRFDFKGEIVKCTKIVMDASNGIVHIATTNFMNLSGGPSITSGASLLLYGPSHATLAKDVEFRSDANIELHYDDSASIWDFNENQIVIDKTTADAAFFNLKAVIGADAVSAISSLTTSGAVTHHLQYEINGTTFWIPGSTTDPS